MYYVCRYADRFGRIPIISGAIKCDLIGGKKEKKNWPGFKPVSTCLSAFYQCAVNTNIQSSYVRPMKYVSRYASM